MSDPPTPSAFPAPLVALHVLDAWMQSRADAGQPRIWMSPAARAALKEIIRMKPGRMNFAARSLRDERSARLDVIKTRAEAGEKARGMGTLRDIMVFATGDPCAQLMLVGEAPGADEERLREPFVGPAGKLLDRILNAMGLPRSSVYISNICKFRPKMVTENQRSGNRKPTPLEMDACLEFVREEIRIVQPRALVALGGTAAEGLLGEKVSVNRERGRWREFEGIPLMITFHPSYLLRQDEGGPDAAMTEKRKVWEDMMMVMEKLELPVSEKQRGYFLKR